MLTGCADIGFRGWCDGPVAKWAGWVSGKGSKKVVLVFPSVCLARTGFDAMPWDERCGFHVAEFSGKGFRYDGTGVVIRMGVLVGGSVGFW